VGQGVLSFNRDVISAIINPEIIKSNVLHQDVINRINEYQA